MPGYITDREAAHITGDTIDDIHRLIADGALPNTHIAGDRVEIKVDDLVRLG